MSYFSFPQWTFGGQRHVVVVSQDLEEKLDTLINEQKKTNIFLSLMTNETVRDIDIIDRES